MLRISVDPDTLDAEAYAVKVATGVLDGVRLDAQARLGGVGDAVGDRVARRAASDLAGALGAFLLAARDELAAMSEFANLAADSYRQADGALGP